MPRRNRRGRTPANVYVTGTRLDLKELLAQKDGEIQRLLTQVAKLKSDTPKQEKTSA